MNPENNTENSSSISSLNKKNTLKSIIKEVVIFALIAFGLVLPFRMFIAEPYLVSGASMDPTFETGDYLIIDKLSYKRGVLPERNSVVVFKFPGDTSKSFIKRIIGLPGERIVIQDNLVTIVNSEHPEGFQVDSSYVTHKSTGYFDKTLGADEYFVMGDNRAESYDSRTWGPLNKKYILGKPVLRLFPFKEMGLTPGDKVDKKGSSLTS